jgi:hypothetical protein
MTVTVTAGGRLRAAGSSFASRSSRRQGRAGARIIPGTRTRTQPGGRCEWSRPATREPVVTVTVTPAPSHAASEQLPSQRPGKPEP